jgi:hypothetical protein
LPTASIVAVNACSTTSLHARAPLDIRSRVLRAPRGFRGAPPQQRWRGASRRRDGGGTRSRRHRRWGWWRRAASGQACAGAGRRGLERGGATVADPIGSCARARQRTAHFAGAARARAQLRPLARQQVGAGPACSPRLSGCPPTAALAWRVKAQGWGRDTLVAVAPVKQVQAGRRGPARAGAGSRDRLAGAFMEWATAGLPSGVPSGGVAN